MNEEETLIPRAINHLAKQAPGTKEYDEALKAYNTLVLIEKTKKEIAGPSRLDKVLGNAPIIGLIGNWGLMIGMLYFEKTDIITSSVRNLIRSK
jgi:hypothetical protein